MSYELIDSGNFQKFEMVGGWKLIRQAAQAPWRQTQKNWKADVTFTRLPGGDGKWSKRPKDMPENWKINLADLKFSIRLTDFGHLGIFPEQAMNWPMIEELCRKQIAAHKECRVLNLFAYTGGS